MNVNLKAYKILLIEDYLTMRTAIKDMLSVGEVQYVVEAENAKAGLMAMEKHKFDIVLCDYNLGLGQTGQQLLEEAKHRKLLPDTAIFIMVTAEQAPSVVLSAIDDKPDEYLVKPFNTHQLLSRIEKQILRKAYFADIDAAIDRDDLPGAIAYCEKLLGQRDPKMNTQLLKVRAELAINVGDFKTAERCYQEVLIERDLAWAKLGLGVTAYLQNKFVTAIDRFQEVLVKAPMMVETYDWLTKAYEAVEKTMEAQNTLKDAVELSPLATLRQQKLALLAEQTGNNELAFKAYKSAIKFGEHSIFKSSQDFGGLAKLYFQLNQTMEAFKTIQEMRKNFQNNLEMELRAACLETTYYFKQKQVAQSEQAYAPLKPITRQCNDLPKYLLLEIAEVHHLVGHVAASNELIESLIGNYVDDDRFMKDLLRRHQAFSNDLFYADELFKRTKLELMEVNNVGVNLFKQGEVAEALALLETAYNKVPNNKFILTNLIKILLQDMKMSGITKQKHLKISHFILKAASLGVSKDKTGNMKMELAKLVNVSNDRLSAKFS